MSEQHAMGLVLFSGDESPENYLVACPVCGSERVTYEVVYTRTQGPEEVPRITSEFTAYEDSYTTCDAEGCEHSGLLGEFTILDQGPRD